MSLLSKYFKKANPDKKVIFIVEDNEVYAQTLSNYLEESFPNLLKIKTYSIGEMCLPDIERKPFIVIIDYFLNSKYEKASNGLEIIKRIKSIKPHTNIIVLSVQQDFSVIIDAIRQYDCMYVQKDAEAFKKVQQLVTDIFNSEKPKIFEPVN